MRTRSHKRDFEVKVVRVLSYNPSCKEVPEKTNVVGTELNSCDAAINLIDRPKNLRYPQV